MENDQVEYVGFWERVVASIVDSIIIDVVTLLFFVVFFGIAFWTRADFRFGEIVLYLVAAVFPIAFSLVYWGKRQATPGKMAVSAVIVDAETGCEPSMKQYVVRYLAYFLSALPLGLGFLWVAFDPKKQGWHDKLAGTAVIKKRRLAGGYFFLNLSLQKFKKG